MKPSSFFRLPWLLVLAFASLSAGADAGVPAHRGATALIAEGSRLWEAGDLDAAIQRFQAAAEADPGSVDARLKLGGIHLARNEFGAGVEAFQQAVAIDPNNANAFIALGIAYMHGDNDGPAHAAFSEAIRLDPSRFKTLEPVMERLEAKQVRGGMHGPSSGSSVLSDWR